jgi:hypothetical protein
MMASAIAVAAIIAIGVSDAQIDQSQDAMRLTVKMTSTIGKSRAGRHRSSLVPRALL